MDMRQRVRLATMIFNEYDAAIRASIRRYVRNEHDADDIYQEIFLSLVRTPPRTLTSLLANLHKVVRNHTLDAARRSASYNRCI